MKHDYIFENHGSIWLCRPTNKVAVDWLKSSVDDEAQWLGNALAVDPRYVESLANNLAADGFTMHLGNFR